MIFSSSSSFSFAWSPSPDLSFLSAHLPRLTPALPPNFTPLHWLVQAHFNDGHDHVHGDHDGHGDSPLFLALGRESRHARCIRAGLSFWPVSSDTGASSSACMSMAFSLPALPSHGRQFCPKRYTCAQFSFWNAHILAALCRPFSPAWGTLSSFTARASSRNRGCPGAARDCARDPLHPARAKRPNDSQCATNY